MLQVSLYRYNPETDEAPYMQDFSVDTGDRDLLVLDVLELIKADLDERGHDATPGGPRAQ